MVFMKTKGNSKVIMDCSNGTNCLVKKSIDNTNSNIW